ncbi:MAG: hypothetical protein F6J86_08585 [Symploca sp. SIO1B1]|nr:hypothetical protein [Symploca sp. SIO1B1]
MLGSKNYFYKLGVYFVTLVLFLSPIIDTARLLQYTKSWSALWFYTTLPTLTILFSLAAWNFPKKLENIHFDQLEIILIISVLWSLWFTAYYGGNYMDICGNIIRIFLALGCYRSTKKLTKHIDIKALHHRLAIAGFWGILVAIIILYTFGVYGSRPVYLGLSTAGLFPSMAIALSGYSIYHTFLSFGIAVLVILGGKRGSMLAMVVMILVSLLLSKKRGFTKVEFFLYILIITIIVVGITINLINGFEYGINSFLPDMIVNRFQVFINYFSSGNLDINLALSERHLDILDSWRAWQNDKMALFSGFGLGAVIESSAGVSRSTIHISPIALAYIFGMPLAIILIVKVVNIPIKNIVKFKRNKLDIERLQWCLTSIGLLAMSLSVFSFLQDPVLWISLGVLSGQSNSGKTVNNNF